MLLTITNTSGVASDFGYLLHKNPSRAQSFELSCGEAHVFYPEASEQRCTIALLLDVDPIALVRGRGHMRQSQTLTQYVNDRPYVASSFLSVALAKVFGSALNGRCKGRPELVDQPLSLKAKLSVVPCRGGEEFLRKVFEPLGYGVRARRQVLDSAFPDWGDSAYFTVELEAEVRLRDLLNHLYVLIPVLDSSKHYFIDVAEVDKLLKHAKEWLADHPARDEITQRYLKRMRGLTKRALSRLLDEVDQEEQEDQAAGEEEAVEERISLNEQRLGAVLSVLRASGAKRVLDLGCGEGKLLKRLFRDRSFEFVAGMDVSIRALEKAKQRLHWDDIPDRQKERISLFHASLMYRDSRLAGFDAAALVEVIEHLDAPRLAAFERVVFEHAQPRTLVVTTPNVEYNVLFENLPAGRFRHRDHRFEWTRLEFKEWAETVCTRFGYRVRFLPVGTEHEEFGAPTQMAVFER